MTNAQTGLRRVSFLKLSFAAACVESSCLDVPLKVAACDPLCVGKSDWLKIECPKTQTQSLQVDLFATIMKGVDTRNPIGTCK